MDKKLTMYNNPLRDQAIVMTYSRKDLDFATIQDQKVVTQNSTESKEREEDFEEDERKAEIARNANQERVEMIQRVLAKNKQEEERRQVSTNSKNYFTFKYHELLDLKKKLNKVFQKSKKKEGESSKESEGENKDDESNSQDDREYELRLKLQKEQRQAAHRKNSNSNQGSKRNLFDEDKQEFHYRRRSSVSKDLFHAKDNKQEPAKKEFFLTPIKESDFQTISRLQSQKVITVEPPESHREPANHFYQTESKGFNVVRHGSSITDFPLQDIKEQTSKFITKLERSSQILPQHHMSLTARGNFRDDVKERFCENVLLKKFDEDVRKPFSLDEDKYEEELHSLVKAMNNFGDTERLYFMPECCKQTLLQMGGEEMGESQIAQGFNTQRNFSLKPLAPIRRDISINKNSVQSPGTVKSSRQAYSDLKQLQLKYQKSSNIQKVHVTRVRQFIVLNEDKNAIATDNLYAKFMVRYDADLVKIPHIQVKIIINEIRMLKAKGASLKNLLYSKRNEIPKVFSQLAKGHQVNFNEKFEQVTALLINISTVLLQEFSNDPQAIGIPDISYITEDVSTVDDEIKAFQEDLDVYMLVLKYFNIATDVYIILSCDFEREQPTLAQITNMLRQMAKARFIGSELMNIYKDLYNSYEKKVERLEELQEQVDKSDVLKLIYYKMQDRVQHNVMVKLPDSIINTMNVSNQAFFLQGGKAHISKNGSPISNVKMKDGKSLKKVVEAMKRSKEQDEKKREMLHQQIQKKRDKKQSVLEKLQIELGRFKIEFDKFYGDDRKLCKSNITERTKYLIEKQQSKRKSVERNIQLKILNQARETEKQVRLDFEMESTRPKKDLENDENKYYRAIRKVQFHNGGGGVPQSNDDLALKRMKFNLTKDIEDIDKAVEIGHKFCKSKVLKVGLQELQEEMLRRKKEILKKKKI